MLIAKLCLSASSLSIPGIYVAGQVVRPSEMDDMTGMHVLIALLMALLLSSMCLAQDVSPIQHCHVWLPMTGWTPEQLDDARAAGYDTVFFKVHPPVSADGETIDFTSTDRIIRQAEEKGFKILLAILGWVGLGNCRFWDVDESGEKIPNQLDPFWPEAMQRVEWYYAQIIDRYKRDPKVVGFVPTWGIYGEAGFTSLTAGRSPHALARFNEWRARQGLAALDALPTRKDGPNTEFNRFIRFRYLYIEQQFDAMIRRLKERAEGVPVGMWQELYPIVGYLWNMVEVPSADLALYESCFPFQTNHHPEKSLGETMGFRYRCSSAKDYRDYYLPLLARKRGEGQRFMGCQLTNDYVKNYGWTEDRAKEIGFDRWEDEFGPYLKKLLNAPLESPSRDVLLVFPTYAAAALTDSIVHFADAAIIDVMLRMYGCQVVRYGSPRLDKMSIAEMDRFRLIIVPDSAYILRPTYERLKRTKAIVLFTGCFAQALDAELTPFGQSRTIDGMRLHYLERPADTVSVAAETGLTAGLRSLLRRLSLALPLDEAFHWEAAPPDAQVILKCGDYPLVSTWRNMIFIHGHLFASACWNPKRVPPNLAGSKDSSANEVDMWGPYDSAHPANNFSYAFMKNLLNYTSVDYRVPNPKPRTLVPYLGDHMEQASISANLVYNNTAYTQRLTIRLPYVPKGRPSRFIRGRYETQVTVPPFSYVVIESQETANLHSCGSRN